MNNVVAFQPPAALRSYTPAQLTLIRQTVAKDTTPAEFDMFVEVCRNGGFDPFRRQIYCLVYNKDDAEKRRVVFITGIDGFRAVAARNRDYRPDDKEPEIVTDESRKSPSNPLGIVKATVRAYKYGPDGQWHPCVGVAYWDEFAVMKQDGDFEWVETGEVYPQGHKKAGRPKYRKEFKGDAQARPDGKWATMPHTMLSKCAEAQALRKGWPETLSGIYAPEEMERPMLDVTPSDAVEQHAQEARMQRIGAVNTIPILWEAGQPLEAVPVGEFADRVQKFLRATDSPTQIEVWRAANQIGLNQFWALHKGDAHELKKLIEARHAELMA